MVHIMVANLSPSIKLSFLFRSKYAYCKPILNHTVTTSASLFYDINRITLCSRPQIKNQNQNLGRDSNLLDILKLSKDVSIIETPPYNSMRMKLHHSYFNHSYFNHSYVINFKLNVSNS